MPKASAPSQSRLRGFRWLGAGLLDQVVIAAANAGNTLLGMALLDRGRSGWLVLSLSVGYLAMYVTRSFVGDVLVALGPRYEEEQRARLVRDGAATAVVAGLFGAVVFTLLWWLWPRGGDVDLRDLIWIAPFLPMIMLHDLGRCAYLAAGRPGEALRIDLIWVTVQAAAVITVISLDAVSADSLLACWGAGATVGALVFCLRARVVPWRGSPRRWVAQTRHLAGWFTATAVVGQLQVQAVGFVVAGTLSRVEVSGLRFAQTVLMQPVQNLITALQGLLVPRLSRRVHEASRLTGKKRWKRQRAAAADLRRETFRLAAGLGVLGGLLALIVWPVGSYVLEETGKFADVAPLALPVGVQAVIFLVQLPFAAAMRGMHRAKELFFQYLLFAVASLTGLIVGSTQAGLLGGVWGQVIGGTLGLLVMMALFDRASRSAF